MPAPCDGCASHRTEALIQLGLKPDKFDYLIALAGNPNTGKSTVFNALTGLRQHTGNWPGKTVTRAEGMFSRGDRKWKVVDLPGTYSLQAGSTDEEVARDFVLYGRPDVTVIVADATRLERNLNLVIQILEITDRVVLCLNLMDEARRHGIGLDVDALSARLGVPVVPTAARSGVGMDDLLDAIEAVATGKIETTPFRATTLPEDVEAAAGELSALIKTTFQSVPNARWVALRLLNADERVAVAVRTGELGDLGEWDDDGDGGVATTTEAREAILDTASRLRWTLRPDFHDEMVEHVYAAAHEIADAARVRGVKKAKFTPRHDAPNPQECRCRYGDTVVVGWLGHRRRVPRHRVGGQRDAPADGHFFPDVYAARRFRIFAASGVQLGLPVPPRRGARKASAHDVHGVRMQCSRRCCHSRNRQPSRTTDRNHHEQFLIVQRAVADADPYCVYLHRNLGAGAPRGIRIRCRCGGHRVAGNRVDVLGFVVSVPHDATGRSHDVQYGAAALSAAEDIADVVHVAHRPHSHRALACRRVRSARGCRDLASFERDDRWDQHC